MMTPQILRQTFLIGALFPLWSGSLFAADWPHFLGPRLDLHSEEKGLNFDLSETGPEVIWEVERGKGHAGPVVADGKLVFIHQVEKKEQVRCLDAATGEEIW